MPNQNKPFGKRLSEREPVSSELKTIVNDYQSQPVDAAKGWQNALRIIVTTTRALPTDNTGWHEKMYRCVTLVTFFVKRHFNN